MTSSFHLSPDAYIDAPHTSVHPMGREQFWTSILISGALLVVAIVIGGRAINFEEAASAPPHWVAVD